MTEYKPKEEAGATRSCAINMAAIAVATGPAPDVCRHLGCLAVDTEPEGLPGWSCGRGRKVAHPPRWSGPPRPLPAAHDRPQRNLHLLPRYRTSDGSPSFARHHRCRATPTLPEPASRCPTTPPSAPLSPTT